MKYIEKKNLLSIGELAKTTSVHTKSLRYYDKLGILKPKYIDSKTGYRYYSFDQKEIVDAIQFCVESGIPLKDFSLYINETGPWINYKNLVDDGTILIEEKISILQNHLSYLKDMQREIERAEISYQNEHPEIFFLKDRFCWIEPYEGKLGSDDANNKRKKIIMKIYNKGFKLGNAYGFILKKENNDWKQYMFVDILKEKNIVMDQSPIFHIPAGKYLCKKIDHSNIHQVWNWSTDYISTEQIELILEVELFLGNYSFSKPIFEQRCLLK